jgi:hypothetical protein
VVVVASTDVPAAFSSSTVAPATPDSPLSSRPLPFASIQTSPLRLPAWDWKPASTLVFCPPTDSVMGAVRPVTWLKLESAPLYSVRLAVVSW